jgi:hypothetical protein
MSSRNLALVDKEAVAENLKFRFQSLRGLVDVSSSEDPELGERRRELIKRRRKAVGQLSEAGNAGVMPQRRFIPDNGFTGMSEENRRLLADATA